jgi:Peptidase family M50
MLKVLIISARYLFGLQAVFLLMLLPASVYLILHRPELGQHIVRTVIVLAVTTLLGAFLAYTWVAVKSGKPSGKGLGIAASALNILTIIPAMPAVAHVGMLPVLFLPMIGAVGLIGFLTSYEVADQKTKERFESVKGDCTSGLLNRAAFLFGFLPSGIAFWCWLSFLHDSRIQTSNGPGYIIQLLLMLFIVVTLHELGHASIGWGLGMKLRSFTAGPIKFSLCDGKWDFKFNPKGIWAPEGAVGVVPATVGHAVWCDLAVAFAGPAVNLISAMIALVIAYTSDPNDPIQLHGMLALFGMDSLAVGLMNLVPFRTQKNYSDGARIAQMLAGGPFSDLHRVVSVVSSSLVTPLRPSNYDIAAIQSASESFQQGDRALLLRLYATSHYLERGMMPEAEKAVADVERVYLESASGVSAELHTSIIFDVAYIRRDPVATRAWWERMQAKKPTRFNADYRLAESALCWVEGYLTAAEEAWHCGAALVQALPSAGAYEYDRYRYHLLRKELDAARIKMEATSPMYAPRIQVAEA